MAKILIQAEPHGDTFKLSIPSEYNRLLVKDMVRSGRVTLFELVPRVRGSKKQRGYLEGAVVPAYGLWQYDLDPRQPKNAEKARDLFKYDFNYIVVAGRDKKPRRVPQSLKGKHAEVLDRYTEWAQENGAPVPNEQLYKKWRDEYSMDTRYDNYYDWLAALGLECDAMPSAETFNKLDREKTKKT